MPGAFLQQDRVSTGSVASAQATIATMPITNLQDPQPRRRARLMGSSATITADLGAEVPVDCVALISTTLGAGAMVQARLATVANFSVTLADTGLLNAEAQDESQGNVVLVLPAPVTARYIRIDLTDGAAPYMDIGLLVAGQLWRLQRGTAYGIREGRVMLDRRDRNPYTGAEFPVPAIVNPRMAAFTLPALSTAEARNQHRDMLRRLGAARDTLWLAELTDSMAERNRRAIWGAMNAPGERRRHQPGQPAVGVAGVQGSGEGVTTSARGRPETWHAKTNQTPTERSLDAIASHACFSPRAKNIRMHDIASQLTRLLAP